MQARTTFKNCSGRSLFGQRTRDCLDTSRCLKLRVGNDFPYNCLPFSQVFVVEAFNLRRGDTLTGSMSNSRFVSVELGKGQRERTALRKGASPAWHEEFDFSVWDIDEQVFVQVRDALK